MNDELERLMTKVTFVCPVRGGFEWYEGDPDAGNSGTPTPDKPSFVKEVWVAAHPEGSDRGGYVVWVELEDGTCAFFYEPDCEWRKG